MSIKTINFRKDFIAFFIFLISSGSYGQSYKDEKLLNDIIPYVVNRVEPTVTYYIEDKPCTFFNQQRFFTKEHFKLFTQPLLGLNNTRGKRIQKKRIEKLLKELDFEYLANYKSDTTNWNLTNVKHGQIVEKVISGGYCEIARPVFSKDNKYLFIYFQRSHKASSGASTFGSSNVAVFKMKRNKWKFYTYIGIAT